MLQKKGSFRGLTRGESLYGMDTMNRQSTLSGPEQAETMERQQTLGLVRQGTITNIRQDTAGSLQRKETQTGLLRKPTTVIVSAAVAALNVPDSARSNFDKDKPAKGVLKRKQSNMIEVHALTKNLKAIQDEDRERKKLQTVVNRELKISEVKPPAGKPDAKPK